MDDSVFQAVGLAFGRKTGFEREGAIRTYSRRLFVISEKELETLALEKENDRRLGRFWRESLYSARENHGTAADHNYIAGGIDLSAMLQNAGMSGDEADERLLFAARNYKAVVEHPMTGRYYFGSDGSAEARTPLLALESARIGEDGALCRVKRGSRPRLFFGQRTKNDANQCSFVSDLRCVQPEDMPPALHISRGARRWVSPSLVSLAAMPVETRVIDAGGTRYICFGVDLCAVLAKYGIEENTYAAVEYGASQVYVIKAVHEGDFLLAWYSIRENDGTPVVNSTDLKIYGEGVVLNDVSALRCAACDMRRGPLPRKLPHTSGLEPLDSIFYCAVEPSKEKRLFYYFSRDELRSAYPVREMEYPYNDHRIAKKVRCRGVLISDIIDSLRGSGGERLDIPGKWKMQYLEEDGYHAGTPTYTDSLDDVRGYKRPMMVLEKREMFVRQDEYHSDEAVFSAPAVQCAYRAAESANESAVKGLMGIVVRGEASTPVLAECRVRMFDAENGTLISEKTVKGALDGMRAVIAAPQLERYEALEPSSAVITAADGACADFYYKEKPFVIFADGAGRELEVFAGKIDGAETVPNSREAVAALAASGDAAVLTGKDDSEYVSKRRLYVDERIFAGGTSPYGYEKYLLYRYEGWKLHDVAARLGVTAKFFRAEKEGGTSVKVENPDDCFVAFRRTESKGVPYNTAEYKRKTKDFRRPVLVSLYDGRVICQDVVRIVAEM